MREAVSFLWGIICPIRQCERLWRMARSTNLPLVGVFMLFAALALGACGTTTGQLSATAAQEMALTELSDMQATATVSRARIQITLDFAGTRVAQVEQAGEFLLSNLSALGTDTDFIEANLSKLQSLSIPATATATRRLPIAGATSVAATAANAVSVGISPVPSVVVTYLSTARLDNIVMASGVDDNDCAVAVNPVITPNSAQIYVVARAYGIPAGATLSSSWQYKGQERVYHSFETEQVIDDNCIWFFIDKEDTAFTLGTWAVQISMDGARLSPLLPFQIVEG